MSKPIALVASGAVLAFAGAAVALGGTTALAFAGSDDTVASGSRTVSTASSALVTEEADMSTTGIPDQVTPSARVTVTGREKPVFVGVGPAAEVERYLAGTSFDTVTDFEVDPFELTTEHSPGSARVGPPADESFWLASEAGTRASISWKLRDGDYRLVVMNSDGSPGVQVDARAAVRVPHLSAVGIGALVGGSGLALSGAALLALGAVAGQREARARTVARTASAGGTFPQPRQAPHTSDVLGNRLG